MKILVTGAAGFISSYLIPALLKTGADVIATDIVPLPASLSAIQDNITYVRADMGSEAEIYRLMFTEKPTHVIHLVSLLAGPCDANPQLGFKINFQSTMALLDAGVAIGLEKFVMTSSISVFGQGVPEPVADDAVKNPPNVYGQTKLACEHLLRWYREHHGLDVGAVRFPWVFGPGRETGITALYSSKLLDAVARKTALNIDSPEEKGDWLYVKDAVKALLLLLNSKNQPQVAYNIMSGVYTVREVLDLVKTLYPDTNITYLESSPPECPYPIAYDDTNARRDLNWQPDYAIEEAVKEHIDQVARS